jgi:hypothetical protein
MTWPAPDRRDALGLVAPTTYMWGWCASCPCQMDWTTVATEVQARDAAHTYAVRCTLSQRRLVQCRRRARLERPVP